MTYQNTEINQATWTELDQYKQFGAGYRVNPTSGDLAWDYGTVVAVKPYTDPESSDVTCLFRIEAVTFDEDSNRVVTSVVRDNTQLLRTNEHNHRKHCLAAAMISYIEDWRDGEMISEFDFATAMTGEQILHGGRGAIEALDTGASTCICHTTQGLI